jgi:hypothetical protein
VVRIALNDDATGSWAELELGTGDIGDVVRLLDSARAEAQDALDLSVRDNKTS